MRKLVFLCIILFLAMFSTYTVWAQHDDNCVECHSIHNTKGPKLIAVEPDTKTINPATNAPMKGISALCMGCHKGEGGPEIAIMKSHPVGVIPNPKKATVPAEFLRDGSFECSSCHDFHPNSTNYKYLRVDAGTGGKELGKFCAACHADKRKKEKAAATTAPTEKK